MKAIDIILEARALIAEQNEDGVIKPESDTDVLSMDMNATVYLNQGLREYREHTGILSELALDTSALTAIGSYFEVSLPTDWDTYEDNTNDTWFQMDIKGRKIYIPSYESNIKCNLLYTPTPQYITDTDVEVICYNQDVISLLVAFVAMKLAVIMREELTDVMNMLVQERLRKVLSTPAAFEEVL